MDGGFQVPSLEATKAVEVATGMLAWFGKNESVLHRFSMWLYKSLEECFEAMHLRREKMWRGFHKIRTSAMFRSQWEVFLGSAGAWNPFFRLIERSHMSSQWNTRML